MNVLFHSIAPQGPILVPGTRQYSLSGHLSIAGRISTALLRLCPWRGPRCWSPLGNTVRSRQSLENAQSFIAECAGERSDGAVRVGCDPGSSTPSARASAYPLSHGLHNGENHSYSGSIAPRTEARVPHTAAVGLIHLPVSPRVEKQFCLLHQVRSASPRLTSGSSTFLSRGR